MHTKNKLAQWICILRRYLTKNSFTVRAIINTHQFKLGFILCSLLLSSGNTFAESVTLQLTQQNIPPSFQANYQLEKGSLHVGNLAVMLEKPSDKEWVYSSNTYARGVAVVFLGKKPITDTSHLNLIEELIRPVNFEHIQKRGKKDRSQYIAFDWNRKSARAKYKDKDNNISLEDNMFDNFSFQLLLMANINQLPNEFTLPVISKAKHKLFNFYTIGIVELSTTMGTFKTLLIERRKDNEKKSTYRIWAAIDAYGLPLQIEKIEHGKREYIAKITSTNLLPQKP